MLTTESFIKSMRNGRYVKKVREHYIRDDIYCGIDICRSCKKSPSTLTKNFVGKSFVYDPHHYLILDTNIILDQIDVLEDEAIGNVIILHTVLKEVKRRSLPIYKRMHAIVENSSRSFYIFTNDHHHATYTTRNAGESANNFNDRCIRLACTWYEKHLPSEKFVFVTDDADNRDKAIAEKITSCSFDRYVKQLNDNETLLDKMSRRDFHSNDTKEYFPPHLPLGDIMSKIQAKKLYQGTFRSSRDNFLEGTVTVDGLDEQVLIQGREQLNRAVDGDLVAVELFDKNLWRAPTDIILEDDAPMVTEGDVEENETQECDKSEIVMQSELDRIAKEGGDVQPTGKVVGIVRRKWKQYCGILQSGDRTGSFHIFVPANKKISKVVIQTRNAEVLKDQKIVVAIDSWPRTSRYPHGHFVRTLGKIGDKTTENEVILLEHDVPHSQFSKEVLKCLPQLPWIITDDDLKKRVDLRDIIICSVDPPGCTDIDDALHCRTLPNGNYEVGVHIADVSHFIRPDTAIDREAASRATTVYLVDKRIDMVPELLSSNLCSLRGGEERFAFSCIWEIEPNAQIVDKRFHKSIIKSAAALTYEQAQCIIDDDQQQDAVAQSLRGLNALAKIMKRRRLENGALVLASPEVKIHMDSETHEPIDVQVKQIFGTMSMVEEFMLQANISVAEKILEEFPDCAMLRRHPQPPPDNFLPLVKAGKHLGFEIDVNSGKLLADSLDKAVKDDNPFMNTMLRILATRCMMQAVYFSSGTLQRDEFRHYGLAVPLYTHFTSPIRRYADVIVHRLLAVCVAADSTYPDLLDKHKSTDLCQNLNYRNRMAQYAGRASVAFNAHLFFKDCAKQEEGYVLFVKRNALQILLPKYGLECTLYLSRKDEMSKFTYNDEEHTQTCGDVTFHAFDPVIVQMSLNANNIQHQKFELQLVKPFIEGFSVSSLPEIKRKLPKEEACVKIKKTKV